MTMEPSPFALLNPELEAESSHSPSPPALPYGDGEGGSSEGRGCWAKLARSSCPYSPGGSCGRSCLPGIERSGWFPTSAPQTPSTPRAISGFRKCIAAANPGGDGSTLYPTDGHGPVPALEVLAAAGPASRLEVMAGLRVLAPGPHRHLRRGATRCPPPWGAGYRATLGIGAARPIGRTTAGRHPQCCL
jgi:hypothetical protein